MNTIPFMREWKVEELFKYLIRQKKRKKQVYLHGWHAKQHKHNMNHKIDALWSELKNTCHNIS